MNNVTARLIPVALVVLLVAACQTADEPATENASEEQPAEETASNTVDHAAAVETIFAVWNSKNYDELDAVLAPDFRRRGPDQNAESLEEMKDFMRQVHTAYPDFHIEMKESAYDGDVGFTHWKVTGTHSGEGSVPATGKSIDLDGATVLRFGDGLITEEIAYFDTAALQAQLGVESVPHAE